MHRYLYDMDSNLFTYLFSLYFAFFYFPFWPPRVGGSGCGEAGEGKRRGQQVERPLHSGATWQALATAVGGTSTQQAKQGSLNPIFIQ